MRILFSNKSQKQLSNLNPFIREKIIKVIDKLENGERVDISKMKGEVNQFRVRVGEYRILLDKLPNGDFLLTEIGKRENIYFFGFLV